jgi:hypothetical protein
MLDPVAAESPWHPARGAHWVVVNESLVVCPYMPTSHATRNGSLVQSAEGVSAHLNRAR